MLIIVSADSVISNCVPFDLETENDVFENKNFVFYEKTATFAIGITEIS